jgi:hypothetical protein
MQARWEALVAWLAARWEAVSACLGVLLLVAGFLIRVVKGEYDLIFDILGIVIFLVSILFYLDRLVGMVKLSTSKISDLEGKLCRIETNFTGLKSGFDREPLFATVRPVIASLKSTQDDFIFTGFALTLEAIAQRYLETTALALNLAHQSRAQPASLDDIAPVSTFLEHLAVNIPNRSVWLGLSLLTNLEAWEGADRYTRWSRKLRERGKLGEVHICRVWSVRNQNELNDLGVEMRKQANDEVIIRYLSPDVHNDLERLIMDLSLIWIPDSNSQEITRAALAENPIAALKASRYRSLPSLFFTVLGATYLESVSAETAERTQERNENYEIVWKRAQPFLLP